MPGISWEIAFPLGAAVILVALIWGLARNKSRNRANDPVTEAATREEYDRPEEYSDSQRRFEHQLRPDEP